MNMAICHKSGPVQAGSTCFHPTPYYQQDFFLLRLLIKIGNKPTIIKTSTIDDGLELPMLSSPDLGVSIDLKNIANQVCNVLALHHISVCRAYYDENYPLYAIDFPPPMTTACISSLLPSFSHACLAILEKYFSDSSTNVSVDFELHLCSPFKDGNSKVTPIVNSHMESVSDELVHNYMDSRMFQMQELFGSPDPNYSEQLPGHDHTQNTASIQTDLPMCSPLTNHDGSSILRKTSYCFMIRFIVNINEQQTAIVKSDSGMPLVSTNSGIFASFSSIAEPASMVLLEHGISSSHMFHDTVSVIIEIDTPSDVSILKSFLSHQHNVVYNLSVLIKKKIKQPLSKLLVEIDMELYLLTPNTSVNLVTLANISYYHCLCKPMDIPVLDSSLFTAAQEEYHANMDVKVEIRDLHQELIALACVWQHLGVQLGIPTHILQKIRIDRESSNQEDCLLDMLFWWEKNQTSSWSTIVKALCILGKKDCAWRISTKYGVRFPIENIPQGEQWIKMRKSHHKELSRTHTTLDESKELVAQGEDIMKSISELESENSRLKKQLMLEQNVCHELYQCKEEYMQESEDNRSKLDATLQQIKVKEVFIERLETKLLVSKEATRQVQLQLEKLSSDLAEKASELEMKSHVLQYLEDIPSCDEESLDGNTLLLAQEAELLRSIQGTNPTTFVQQIEQQLLIEEKELDDVRCQKRESAVELSQVRNELLAMADHLRRLKSQNVVADHCTSKHRLELQLAIVRKSIEVINSRYELIFHNKKLRTFGVQIEQRSKKLEFTRQWLRNSLQLDHGKTQVKGFNQPVHKTNAYELVAFKVCLYDKNGQPSWQKALTARLMLLDNFFEETIEASTNEEEPGCYRFTYTPPPGEHIITIHANDEKIDSFNVLATNIPDPPHCSVVIGAQVLKNSVATADVFLADQNSCYLNTKQTVSASLAFQTDDDAGSMASLISIESVSSAKYTVALLPRSTGKAVLTVFVNNEVIAKPVELTVTDSDSDALTEALKVNHTEFFNQILAENADLDQQDITPGVPLERLESQEWYFGDINPRLAAYKCKNDGDYLVRYSFQQDSYALTCKYKGAIRHFRIPLFQNELTGKKYYWFEVRAFLSIQLLLDYHTSSRTPVTKESGVIISTYVSNRDQWELNRAEIKKGRKIVPSENFYQGVLSKENARVTVKISNLKKLLQEADILREFQHPNIISILGVCSHKFPVYIVMEHMSGGVLLDFLWTKGSEQTKKKFCKMAIDIAKGMSYLESQCYIHCDLTSLNCLVGDNDIVKIADFSMSVHSADKVYEAEGTFRIRIKSTAPEVLISAIFTTASDVWSFGILLWEIFSCGSGLYPDMTDQEARRAVKIGYRMPPPTDCPLEVYSVMRQCWLYDPEARPDFKMVLAILMQTYNTIP